MIARTLHIGEKVYVVNVYCDYALGTIVTINGEEKDYSFKGDEDEIKVIVKLLADFDGRGDVGDEIVCSHKEIYQIVPKLVDNRVNGDVCYECHQDEFEDKYPYYSPQLCENLFEIETVNFT